MKAVVQRVKSSSVRVEGKVVGEIGPGLLIFHGVQNGDLPDQTSWLVNKILSLRIFEDSAGKMNLSVEDIGGEILVVSQFTLYANCQRGRRPDFLEAAPPEVAEPIYNKFVSEVADRIGKVETGRFGAAMEVSLVNDGPVTLIVEGK